jgi:alkanesulfonate monooxygenase SsuD/methylene tetrahydromethanopterin reductase-like flavin-dependent oxidoreductase (luciferase family)
LLRSVYACLWLWGLFKNVLADNRPELDFETASERAVIGSVEEVAEQLTAFARASGLNLLLARSQWLGIPHSEIERSMELLATEVMPMVNRALGQEAESDG